MSKINRRDFLKASGAAVGGMALSQTLPFRSSVYADEGKRPNVIVCMVDDMGFSDLGCYGGEIPTPNLDAIAAEGVRFSNFHNTSRCCPSRASILTGLYPQHTGQGHFFKHQHKPGYIGGMYRPHVNLGHVTKQVGYATIASGKWHLRPTIQKVPSRNSKGVVPARPTDYGKTCFDDVNYSRVDGSQNYFPERDRKTGKLIDPYGDFGYSTHWYAEGVCNHIDKYAGKQPTLAYWTPNAPHYPLHCLERDLEKVKGKYDGGSKAIAEARYKKAKALGVISKDAPYRIAPEILEDKEDWSQDVRTDKDVFPPKEGFDEYKWANRGNRKLQSARRSKSYQEIMEIYAAQIVALDESIGTVMKKLKEKGEYDNTLFLFCSDNGCSDEGRGTGKAWSQASNVPYKRDKKSAYNGGVRTSCIMNWPDRIKAEAKGSINQTFAHLIDVMPTVLTATGATYPEKDWMGKRDLPELYGKNLLSIFDGETIKLREPIFIQHDSNIALIDEKWKLVSDGGEPWKLYDMQKDPFEIKTLAADNKEVVFTMARQWQEIADRVGARAGGPSSKRPDRLVLDSMKPY